MPERWNASPDWRCIRTLVTEEQISTEAEIIDRFRGAYDRVATKADSSSLNTRLTTWFAGLLLLMGINLLGTVTGILTALLG